MGLMDEVGEYALSHGGTADVAVADEKYFNFHVFPPKKVRFAAFCAYFGHSF